MPDADAEIEPLLHQIDHPVHQQHARRHAREGVQIRRHHRQDVPPPEHHRRRERQHALRLGLLAGQAPLGRVEIPEHAPAGLEIGAPRLGQGQPPRGPGDETDVQRLLERLQMAADRGERHGQPTPRRRQTARIGDGDEHAHGGETVHFILPKYGTMS